LKRYARKQNRWWVSSDFPSIPTLVVAHVGWVRNVGLQFCMSIRLRIFSSSHLEHVLGRAATVDRGIAGYRGTRGFRLPGYSQSDCQCPSGGCVMCRCEVITFIYKLTILYNSNDEKSAQQFSRQKSGCQNVPLPSALNHVSVSHDNVNTSVFHGSVSTSPSSPYTSRPGHAASC